MNHVALLLTLESKLPEHTYLAVERRAAELDGEDRRSYLQRVLDERERSEGGA